MRTVNIWIEETEVSVGMWNSRKAYAISTEYSDPYYYPADSEGDAVKMFENDRHVTVGKVYHF